MELPAEQAAPRECGQHGGVKGLHPRTHQKAQAICASPASTRNPKPLAGAKAHCLVPPIGFLGFRGALARASAPIEEGERCHMCDLPAVILAYHVAWCQDCACAVLMAKGVSAVGPLYKKTIPRHAMEHAFR